MLKPMTDNPPITLEPYVPWECLNPVEILKLKAILLHGQCSIITAGMTFEIAYNVLMRVYLARNINSFDIKDFALPPIPKEISELLIVWIVNRLDNNLELTLPFRTGYYLYVCTNRYVDLDQKLRDWLNDNGLKEYVSSHLFDNLYIYLYCSNEIQNVSQFHNFLHELAIGGSVEIWHLSYCYVSYIDDLFFVYCKNCSFFIKYTLPCVNIIEVQRDLYEDDSIPIDRWFACSEFAAFKNAENVAFEKKLLFWNHSHIMFEICIETQIPFSTLEIFETRNLTCSSPHNVTQDRPPYLTDYFVVMVNINSLFVQKYYNSTFTKSEESFTLLGRDFKYPFLFDDMLFIMGIFEDLKSIFVFKNFKLFRRIIVDYSCHTKWEVDNGYVLCLLEPGRTFKFNGNQFEKL